MCRESLLETGRERCRETCIFDSRKWRSSMFDRRARFIYLSFFYSKFRRRILFLICPFSWFEPHKNPCLLLKRRSLNPVGRMPRKEWRFTWSWFVIQSARTDRYPLDSIQITANFLSESLFRVRRALVFAGRTARLYIWFAIYESQTIYNQLNSDGFQSWALGSSVFKTLVWILLKSLFLRLNWWCHLSGRLLPHANWIQLTGNDLVWSVAFDPSKS